ncbi:unnamed protein product [Brachionus calyciflorus]|uniref:Uncharacterized protein n=1 Tax=Brachionus calyciflorus TaxID=104777 RepID=A0A814DEI8_9BILA|nr:unnamed protein product [Brachionus calyciflorus]
MNFDFLDFLGKNKIADEKNEKKEAKNMDTLSQLTKESFDSSISFDLRSSDGTNSEQSIESDEPLSFKKIKILLILWSSLTCLVIGLLIYRFFIYDGREGEE